jgi:hypothetical protein
MGPRLLANVPTGPKTIAFPQQNRPSGLAELQFSCSYALRSYTRQHCLLQGCLVGEREKAARPEVGRKGR